MQSRRNKTARNRNKDKVHHPPVVPLPSRYFGFPPRLQVKLKYSSADDLKTLSSTSGSFASSLFRANSIFDPDYTGTGHQPLYRDVYAGVYDQYAVVASRCTVTFVNQNAANYWNAGIYIDDDVTPASTPSQAKEQSTAQYTLLGPLSSSSSVKTFTSKWTAQDILNIDPYSSETYKTAVGSNPAEVSFFTIFGNDYGGATSTLVFTVEIVYDVLFTELATQAQS